MVDVVVVIVVVVVAVIVVVVVIVIVITVVAITIDVVVVVVVASTIYNQYIFKYMFDCIRSYIYLNECLKVLMNVSKFDNYFSEK